MDKAADGYKKYFEVLELPEDASLTDIKTAYEKMKKLYSSVSMATYPLEEEFDEDVKQEIIKDVETAYKILIRYVVEKDRIKKETIKTKTGKKDKLEDTVVEKEIDSPIELPEPIEFAGLIEPVETVEPVEPVGPVETAQDTLEDAALKGRTLKKIREKSGKGIHEIAVATKISYKILVDIELERFEKLPDAGYLRWHIMNYAKALSLDPKKIADEYMKRYRRWREKQAENDVADDQ